MTEVVSERGYAATRVVDVLRRTGISSRTFYAHFSDLQSCFFVAYDAVVQDLERLLAPDPDVRGGRAVERVFSRVLEHFAVWPSHAQILLVEVSAAGPPGTARNERTMRMLAERLSACERWQPGECHALERQEVAQAVIGAITRMLQLRLNAGEADELPHLLPSLTALTTRVVLAA